MKISEFSSHLDDEGREKTSSPQPTSIESPAKEDQPEDVHSAPDWIEDGAESEEKTMPDAGPEQDLPTCGKYKGSLSFPFGIVSFVKVGIEYDPLIIFLISHSIQLDKLSICDACDPKGVPDVVRSSGRHTEGHHLIRCLAPDNSEDKAVPTPSIPPDSAGQVGTPCSHHFLPHPRGHWESLPIAHYGDSFFFF